MVGPLVSFHLAKLFQRRKFFRNRPKRNKNCLWRPCLLTNRAEMSNLYKGPTIDASYRVSVNLAMQFQRTRLVIIEKLFPNNGEKIVDSNVKLRKQSGLSLLLIVIHICFLPSFGSFGHAVSEENIFYSFQTSISLCWNNERCCHFLLYTNVNNC
jgi:hypothetical protein